MSPWAVLVAAGLVAAFAVELVADLRERNQVRRNRGEGYPAAPPPQARDYVAARLGLGMVSGAVRLTALLVFWAVGGFAALDGLVRDLGFLEEHDVVRGVVFLLLLAALGFLVRLPFSIYGTFVVEERFGFNRTTPGLFVADLVRGLLLGLALGVPVLAGFLYLLDLGPAGWIGALAGYIALSLLLQLLVPRVIMPLFNRFDPLAEGELRTAVLAYGEQVGFPLEDVQVMDASRRSSKGNAFFTGTGRSRRVVLFDTLVERHPVGEVLGVVAHEVGHYKRGHIRRGLVVSWFSAAAGLAAFAALWAWADLSSLLGTDPSLYTALVAFGLILAPFELLAGVAGNALSRRHERQADRFAAHTTGEPGVLADALVRLGEDNLSDPSPDRFYVLLNYSHPPLAERVGYLRAWAGAGGGAEGG